jgi:hypothetical protein
VLDNVFNQFELVTTYVNVVLLQDQPSPLMTGAAPLRQNLHSSRGGNNTPASKAQQLYSRVIRVAAAIQHVSRLLTLRLSFLTTYMQPKHPCS